MNNKNILIGASAIAAIVIIIAIYLYMEDKKNKNRIAELEEDKLKLILDSLNRNKDLSQEIKDQLNKLIKEFEMIDSRISNELVQALQLFQLGQVENAIEDLAKIIEHLLKTHYQENGNFQSWLSSRKKSWASLHDLLTFCKQDGKINDIEFDFFIAIKGIRNNEAHIVDFKLDKYLSASGIIAALGAIIKIAKFVYPTGRSISPTDKI